MATVRLPPNPLIDEHVIMDVWTSLDPTEQAQSRPPPREAIEWHLTYLAEAYLPSHAERLREGLVAAGWTAGGVGRQADPVPAMRASAGGGWTQLGVLVPPSAQSTAFGGMRPAALPDGVASVRVALWSVTSSLTVVSAGFEWDEHSGDVHDRIGKTDHRGSRNHSTNAAERDRR